MKNISLLPWWNLCSTGVSSRKRLSDEYRFKRLQIGQDDLTLYKSIFLSDRIRFKFHALNEDGSWPMRSFRWSYSDVLRHLCGECQIAISFESRVHVIVLDIDCHGDRHRSRAVETARGAVLAIPGDPFVYQSSNSGGVRLIWFLDKLYNRDEVDRWVRQELANAGIAVLSGICEVRLGGAPDRIPFGSFSMPIDPITYEPIWNLTLAESIRLAELHRANNHIILDGLISDPVKINNGDYRSDRLVSICLKNGLPADVSTNDCLLELARHFRQRMGMDKIVVREKLKNWIAQKHNGYSERINRGRIESVYKQIARIIKSLRAAPFVVGAVTDRVGLTKAEMEALLTLELNLRQFRALFAILCLARQKLMKSAHSTYSPDSSPLHTYKKGTNKWGRKLTDSWGVTNGAENSCHVFLDISKKLLRSIGVPGSANTRDFVQLIEGLGILVLKRKPWPDGHKCAQYWVNYPFDVNGVSRYSDFDEALWEIAGYGGIRGRFGFHYARAFRKRFNDS